MDNKVVDNIVWWIPIKKLRNSIREYLTYLIKINDKNSNELVAKDSWYITGFGKIRKDFINDKNFMYKYNKLIANLDINSINIITKVISKISNFNNINDDIYLSKNELEIFNNIKEEMENNIIKVSGYYMYNNKYILNRNEFSISNFYDNLGLDNIENIDYLKNKAIIDAGAWIGDTALILSDYTSNNVYAFEVIKSNFDCMKNIININKKGNIIPVLSALGSESKKMNVYDMEEGEEFHKSFLNDDNLNMQVDMITLDKFVEDNNLEIGLIKTDIEGFERDLLKGAINTIKNKKPILLISIYHSYDDFFNIKPMIEELNLGYKFKILGKHEFKVIGEIKLLAEVY